MLIDTFFAIKMVILSITTCGKEVSCLVLSASSNYNKSEHKKPQLVILLLVLWCVLVFQLAKELSSAQEFGEHMLHYNQAFIPSFMQKSH